MEGVTNCVATRTNKTIAERSATVQLTSKERYAVPRQDFLMTPTVATQLSPITNIYGSLN